LGLCFQVVHCPNRGTKHPRGAVKSLFENVQERAVRGIELLPRSADRTAWSTVRGSRVGAHRSDTGQSMEIGSPVGPGRAVTQRRYRRPSFSSWKR
jgi:hypothetical protein